MIDNAEASADGRGAKPQLVLLSGLLSDETIWSDVKAALADDAEVQVLTFPNICSITAMAEHVLAQAPQRFVLAGHSMGGRVGLEVARLAPERVRALGLLNTGVHAPKADETASRGALVELARTCGMAALAEVWLPPMMNEGRLEDGALKQRLVAMVERATPESFAAQTEALLTRPDAEAALAAFKGPILLLSADGDRWSPIAQHEAMRTRAPRATLRVIEDAGHMSPVEQPGLVAGVFKDWLASLGEERLSEQERLAIEAQCTRALIRYTRLNDEGAYEELTSMFHEDGVLARPSEPETHLRGQKAILASFRARPSRKTRHVVANIEIDVESSTRARSRSTIVLFASGPGEETNAPAAIEATLVGEFDDVLQQTDGQWLFVQRLGRVDMKAKLAG